MYVAGPWMFAWLVLLQLVALSSAVLARVGEKSAAQTICQQLFVVTLLAVSGTTVAAFFSGAGCWFTCAATLPVMVLGATVDLQRGARGSAY